MRAIYVYAPDTAHFVRNRVTDPADGKDVQWIATDSSSGINNLKGLADAILARAGKSPINVLRFLGHGRPGQVAILGTDSRGVIDFSNPETLPFFTRLHPVFDRRTGGYRREVFLHACEGAADIKWTCDNGKCTGGTDRKKWGTTEAPGFTLLQGVANTLDVPAIGAIVPIYTPNHQSSPGGYNWSLPRSLYVYPSKKDVLNQVVSFDSIAGWSPEGAAGIMSQEDEDLVRKLLDQSRKTSP